LSLFSQHLLEGNIEFSRLAGDGNGLFKAVSTYTNESAASLRAMCAAALLDDREHVKEFIGEPFEAYHANVCRDNTPGDALCIYALSKALNRPIIVIFNKVSLDLAVQALLNAVHITKDRPIFVNFDNKSKTYHSLEIRGELYHEEVITQKLTNNRIAALPNSTAGLFSTLYTMPALADARERLQAHPDKQARIAKSKARLAGSGLHIFARSATVNDAQTGGVRTGNKKL